MTYSMLITMGVSYMLCDGMSFLWGNTVRATPVPQMLNGAVRIASMNIAFPAYYVFIIVFAALIALALKLMFNKTKLGIYFRAIISDRHMVECLGINVQLLFTVMFMIGLGLGGIAGALNAPISGLTPQQGLSVPGPAGWRPGQHGRRTPGGIGAGRCLGAGSYLYPHLLQPGPEPDHGHRYVL